MLESKKLKLKTNNLTKISKKSKTNRMIMKQNTDRIKRNLNQEKQN